MSYIHFSITERAQLELLHRLGWSSRAISKELGRHHSTVARELKRNSLEGEYSSTQAEDAYLKRRERCGPINKISNELVNHIEEKLNQTWSPEQIAETMEQELGQRVCFKTIYRWLYQGLIAKGYLVVLRHKGKRQKPKETRGRFNIGKSIRIRPKDIRKRTSFGHWELDTIVSSRGKSKACFATFIERKTRFYLATSMPDRTAASMEMAFKKTLGSYPKSAVLTSTVDRGKEFACYEHLEKDYEMDVYFADPYSSWQRGSNENGNGLLREFFPKRTDLALVSESDLTLALQLINNRPRKCLGWKTAHEAFQAELAHLA